jgi:hypothetical protein
MSCTAICCNKLLYFCFVSAFLLWVVFLFLQLRSDSIQLGTRNIVPHYYVQFHIGSPVYINELVCYAISGYFKNHEWVKVWKMNVIWRWIHINFYSDYLDFKPRRLKIIWHYWHNNIFWKAEFCWGWSDIVIYPQTGFGTPHICRIQCVLN